MDENIAPTRWGRVRFGSRRMPAMAVAVPTGFVVAALFGAAGAILRPEAPLLFGVILGLCLWGPSLALVWALVVDRSTLRGAVRDPEESVASSWYERAAGGAFQDTLTAAGLALAVVAIWRLEFTATLALLGVVLFAMGSFAVRYVLCARRG